MSRPDANEFAGRYERLKLGNGGSWRRDDGPLARKFNIHRIKEQERIAAAEPHNEQQQPTKKPIPEQTKAQLPAPRSAPHIESRARPQAQPAQQPTPDQRLKTNHQQIPTHPPSRQTPQPPPPLATSTTHPSPVRTLRGEGVEGACR